MKGILEERILDAKIEFALREALGIAKKDFHELIINIINRKRQMTAETMMIKALDTHMTKDGEEEIGQVFTMMCDCMDGQGKENMAISSQTCEKIGRETKNLIDEEKEGSIHMMSQYLTMKREKKLRTQNLRQRKIETCRKMKMSEFRHISWNVQI